MKALKIVAAILVVLSVLIIGGGLALPAETTVTREITIDAPPARVYAHVSAPKKLVAWSPWAKLDPNIKWTFEGPERGVGAKYTWKSDVTGDGSQEIVAVKDNASVETSLDFGDGRPTRAWFELTPEGEKTKVLWGLQTDSGANPFARWFGFFLDDLVGPDYEKGLNSLKTVVEGEAA